MNEDLPTAEVVSPSGSAELLSVRRVAELAGLSEMAVYRAIKAGELRASRLRGKFRIRSQDFERWVDKNVVEVPRREDRKIVPAPRKPKPAPAGSGLRELVRQ